MHEAHCCPRCGIQAAHRRHRRSWQRVVSYLVPVRPFRCTNCQQESWALLGHRDSRLPWVSSTVLALLMIAGLLYLAFGVSRDRDQPVPALKLSSSLSQEAIPTLSR